MATKVKQKRKVFQHGDVALDGDQAMIVIGGFSIPKTGQSLFVGLATDGGLSAQYADGLKATGANILDPGWVRGLDGADAFRDSPPRIADGASEIKALADWVLELVPFVRKNGKSGSELVRAFAALESDDDDFTPGVFDMESASREWEKLSVEEQSRILGGWRPAPAVRSVRSFLEEEEAGYVDGEVDFSLVTRCHLDGAVDVGPGWQLCSGTAPVQITIRRGTGREEAMLAIRRALAALERCWPEAIAMPDDRSMRKFEASEFPVVTSGRRGKGRGTA